MPSEWRRACDEAIVPVVRSTTAPAIFAALGVLGLGTGWSCAARLGGAPICSAVTPCDKGFGCVLGRCRNDKNVPVATLASRRTFEPADMVWIGPGGTRTAADIDAALVLGPRAAPTTLLLRFAVDL